MRNHHFPFIQHSSLNRMPSPVCVLYLTCLFLTKTAVTTDLDFSSSARKQSGFLFAKTGEKLTLQCVCDEDASNWLYWYKQPLGQKPKLISRYYRHGNEITFFDELKNSPRFTLDTENCRNHLTISDLQTSDLATYYCMSSNAFVFKFVEGISVIAKGSGLHIPTLVHQSASEIIQPGGSVTLNCTVQTGTCDEELSVYWFQNSGESHPGLIYTHGDSSDQCERKPNTQTHTCVFNLPMMNLSLSHAGTYYCAVASCGHIVFGNGTQLDFEHEVDSLILVYILSGALAFTSVLVVLLSVSLHKTKKQSNGRSTVSRARFLASSTANSEGYQTEDNLHYAALSINLPNKSRRQRSNTTNECVYSGVKQ